MKFLPYSIRARIAPYSYYLIGRLYSDQDLMELAEAMKYNFLHGNPDLIAENQTKFRAILLDRYMVPSEPVAYDGN